MIEAPLFISFHCWNCYIYWFLCRTGKWGNRVFYKYIQDSNANLEWHKCINLLSFKKFVSLSTKKQKDGFLVFVCYSTFMILFYELLKFKYRIICRKRIQIECFVNAWPGITNVVSLQARSIRPSHELHQNHRTRQHRGGYFNYRLRDLCCFTVLLRFLPTFDCVEDRVDFIK